MKMRIHNGRDGLFALALVALLVVGCTVEVNINTKGDEEQGSPLVATVPEAPTAEAPPAENVPPTPAPLVVMPRVIPPPPPAVTEPERGVVRDLLLRYEPAPPPQPTIQDLLEGPAFTPFTVAPSILNREAVVEAMQREYPPLLREAGIGGTARIYFFIDAHGDLLRTRLDQTSGHPALDDAAMRVAAVYRFSSARNRDERVPVWVSFPITFRP